MRTKLHELCMFKPLYTHGTVKLKTPFVSSVRHAWMLGTVPLCNAASVHCSNAAGLAVVHCHGFLDRHLINSA